jgi:hypothetical protein
MVARAAMKFPDRNQTKMILMKTPKDLFTPASWTLVAALTMLLFNTARAEDECAQSVVPQGGVALSAIEVLCPMKDGLARLKISGVWGFVDKAGKLAVEPQFDDLREISDGLAAAQRNKRWGFINKQGRWVIEPMFSKAGSFAHGVAAVEFGGKWGYIDTSGKWIIQPTYETAGPFNGNSAVVSQDYPRELMIDLTGRVIKRFDANVNVFDYPNAAGLYTATVDFDHVLQHRDGRSMPYQRSGFVHYSEGMLVTSKEVKGGEDSQELYGAMDLKGNWAVPPKFLSIKPFNEGLAVASPSSVSTVPTGGAVAKAESVYGLIDSSGIFKLAPTYVSIDSREKSVRNDHVWYRAKRAGDGEDIVNAKGQVIAAFDCDEVEEVSLSRSDERNWAVLSGCGRTWVIREGMRAFSSAIPKPRVQATATHILLAQDNDFQDAGDKPSKFELFTAAGQRVMSDADTRFTEKYDSISLIIQGQGQGSGLPLALVIRNSHETMQLVTPKYEIVSNAQWTYDSDMDDYRYFLERTPIEGPLPMQTASGWGAVDAQGQWIIKPGYSRLTQFEHGVAFATKDGIKLMVDTTGKEHQFPENAFHFERVAPMVLRGRTEDDDLVLLDLRSGQSNVLKSFQVDRIGEFFNGYAAIEKNYKWGLVDVQGRGIVASIYDAIQAVHADETKALIGWITERHIVSDSPGDTLYGWIDAKGNERIAPRYSELRFDKNADALIVRDTDYRYGALKTDGSVLIEPLHESLAYLGDGWFATQRKSLSGLVNAAGEWAAQPGLLRLSDLNHDLSFRKMQRGEQVILFDGQGRVSTQAQPLVVTDDDSASWWPREMEMPDGETNTVFYGVDFKERLRIKGRVDSYKRFSEGVIAFKLNQPSERQSHGLADTSGNVLGVYSFIDIEDMKNGFAAIQKTVDAPQVKGSKRTARSMDQEGQVRFGYLNRQGKLALPPVYEDARNFSDDRASVVVRGNIALIDTNGTLLMHGAWLCGRKPVILDSKKQVIWPTQMRTERRCSAGTGM